MGLQSPLIQGPEPPHFRLETGLPGIGSSVDREDGSLGISRHLSLQDSSQRARLISEGLQQRPFSESLTDGQLAHLSILLSVLCGFMDHISDFFSIRKLLCLEERRMETYCS